VRGANTTEPMLAPADLAGLVTDLPLDLPGVPIFGLEEFHRIANHLELLYRQAFAPLDLFAGGA